jgi:drug/metabolite transporter (DMT)-like permease
MALILMIVAAIAGGSVPPFAKVAGTAFPPFTLVLIRFLLATAVLLPFVYRRHELRLDWFRNLAWVSVIGSLNPILLFIALPLTTASVAPLIYASVPLMTAIYLARGRVSKLPREKLFGLIVGFVGVGIIVLLPLLQSRHVDLQALAGNGLILGAAVAFMIFGVVSKRKQGIEASPLALTFYFCLITLLISIPFSVAEIIRHPISPSSVGLAQIASALEVGVIGSSLLYLSYQQALKISSELIASLFTYLQPVSTIVLATLLLGERLSLAFVMGGAMAVVGAGLASGTWDRYRRSIGEGA